MVYYTGNIESNGKTSVERVDDEGNKRPLDLRLDLVSKSPTGFAWGYSGSEPAQLALAFLRM
jgi:hypothetical protein